MASWAVFLLSLAYAPVLGLGLASLESPNDPIGDPYLSLMELLIVLTAPMMVIVMVAVHRYAARETKTYSLAALAFMLLLAGTTSGVHFVVLTIGQEIQQASPDLAPFLISWKWPSVIYALDILAWDVFFAFSMLFGALVFTGGGIERAIRLVMITSGVLSFLGLIGVPLANMQVRLIGVVGYAVVAPIAFLLLAILFERRTPAESISTETFDS